MKLCRFLSLILVIALLFCSIPDALGDGITSFDARLLSGTTTTAKEWTQSSEIASLFALISLLDLMSGTNYTAEDFDYTCGVIVGRVNSLGVMAIFALSNGRTMAITYTPSLKSAGYQVGDVAEVKSSSDMRTMYNSAKSMDGFDVVYYVSATELIETMNAVQEYLNK